MIRDLSDVLRDTPDYSPQWVAGSENVLASNPPYGEIRHAVVCGDNGQPRYDQPVWTEPIGAICLATTPENKFVLVSQWRHSLLPKDQQKYPLDSISEAGRWSLELPRGFGEPAETAIDTALRELNEETGLIGTDAYVLGELSSNTTFVASTVSVVHVNVEAGAIPKPQHAESILEVIEVSLGECLALLRNQKIVCGMTQAAIALLLADRLGEVDIKLS